MKQMRLLLINLIAICGLPFQAGADDGVTYPVCDIEHEQVLMLDADKSPIILRTHLHSDGSWLPTADRELIFADGERLELYSAGKIIDDWGSEGPPSCEEHLEVVNANYNQGDWSRRTFGDLSETILQQLSGTYECQRPASDGKECYDQGAVHLTKTLAPEEIRRLTNQNAPIISPMMSTYYHITYAFDAENRVLIELYSEGC